MANDKSSQKPFPQNWIKLNKPKLVKIKAKAKVKTVKIKAITKELGMNFWEKEVREEDREDMSFIYSFGLEEPLYSNHSFLVL